jgi:hypothetical protein
MVFRSIDRDYKYVDGGPRDLTQQAIGLREKKRYADARARSADKRLD